MTDYHAYADEDFDDMSWPLYWREEVSPKGAVQTRSRIDSPAPSKVC
jgi:hypothetical protein